MRWMLLFLFVSSILGGFIAPAWATLGKDVCEVYLSDSKDVPKNVRTVMDKREDHAALACLDPKSHKIGSYDSYGEISKTADGVCQFDSYYVDLKTGESSQHEVHMLLAAAACPRQNDVAYVRTSNISSGMFVALKTFWDMLGSSQEAFNQAVSHLPKKDKESSFIENVRDAFFRRPPTPLGGIELARIEPGMARTGYKLEGWGGVYVFVDMTSQGLRVIDVGWVAY